MPSIRVAPRARWVVDDQQWVGSDYYVRSVGSVISCIISNIELRYDYS